MPTPAIIAANMAAGMESVTLPTTAAAKAAARNWPSIETLTTPARSHITPQSAPSTSGVASESVPANWLLTGNGRSRPAAAQVRNPTTTANPATVPATAASRPGIRPLRKPAAGSRQRTAQTATVATPGTVRVGSWTASNASDRANRATPVVEPRATSSNTPTTAISPPVDSRCRRFSFDSIRCSLGAADARSVVAVLMSTRLRERARTSGTDEP